MTFLTRRVGNSDEDDWGKFKMIIRYQKRTVYMQLNLYMDTRSNIKWRLGVPFNTYMDSKSHTGVMTKIGNGAAMIF